MLLGHCFLQKDDGSKGFDDLPEPLCLAALENRPCSRALCSGTKLLPQLLTSHPWLSICCSSCWWAADACVMARRLMQFSKHQGLRPLLGQAWKRFQMFSSVT